MVPTARSLALTIARALCRPQGPSLPFPGSCLPWPYLPLWWLALPFGGCCPGKPLLSLIFHPRICTSQPLGPYPHDTLRPHRAHQPPSGPSGCPGWRPAGPFGPFPHSCACSLAHTQGPSLLPPGPAAPHHHLLPPGPQSAHAEAGDLLTPQAAQTLFCSGLSDDCRAHGGPQAPCSPPPGIPAAGAPQPWPRVGPARASQLSQDLGMCKSLTASSFSLLGVCFSHTLLAGLSRMV